MATLALYDDMLNEHLAYDLLMEELAERNWLVKNVEKNQKWKGGNLPVPFRGARGSSFSQGQLTAENDISDYEYVRGEVSDYKETWGALKFNAKDLQQHVPEGARKKGLVNKDSFLRMLPDQLEDFIDGMKDMVSTMLLNGGHFATLTSDATASDGSIVIDRIERLELKQKIVIDDDNSSAIECYVKTINVNTNTATVTATRGGVDLIDFSANNMTTAQNARIYIPGAENSANAFTSLRSQLLSAANGGSSNLFGQSKLAYPYLQAINVSGASISATNILDQIFDAWTRILQLGKGHADRVVMSYKHIGSVFKLLEAGSGGFRHIDTKASTYGYTEVTVGSVKGTLKLVGVQEMDDDLMYFLDMSAFKLHSNGFFERHIDPNGNGYYIKRATTGYVYITDIRFYGELILHAPCRCGVLFGIPAY